MVTNLKDIPMKLILNYLFLILTFQIVVTGCSEDEYELGIAPTAEDATFTYTVSEENDNIIQFTTASDGFIKKWDFDGGNVREQDNQRQNMSVGFALQGDYEVTLTVFSEGGSASTTQTISIEETDPTLLDLPVYNMLTGGASQSEGKTWVIDATRANHFGVGPNPSSPTAGDFPSYYAAKANEKAGGGLYNDKYTFKLEDFIYIHESNGDVYINGGQIDKFPGAVESPVGDFIAPYTAPDNLKWSVVEEDGKQFIEISDQGIIGYYSGTSRYQIVTLTEEELFLRYLDTADPALAWYVRLVPEGFTPPPPPPPPPPATSILPVTFESVESPFNGFGGTTFSIVDNPDVSGLNASAKVGMYVKGTEGNWAGIETALASKLDFSTNTLIKYKVYSPVTGQALFKLESVDGTATPVEVFADVTVTNEWQELTFDFSEAASDTYDKIAMFLDFENNAGGTFYVDDIRQASVPVVLTEEDLTGGSSKVWVLKPSAGSFGVGPSKGSDEWFPNGQDISEDRVCLFNDQFIFQSGGIYEYNTQGDIYGEAYMGVSDGCQDESNLDGTDAEAWGSGVHSFSFTPATETEPAYITVTGTGAFIALPKAYNGGEYAAGPPTVDASVTYEVLNYVKTSEMETIAITVDVSGDGTAFWSFVLVAE